MIDPHAVLSGSFCLVGTVEDLERKVLDVGRANVRTGNRFVAGKNGLHLGSRQSAHSLSDGESSPAQWNQEWT